MKKFKKASLISLAISLASSSITYADNSERIAEIEAQIEELQAELNKLKAEDRENVVIKDSTDQINLYNENGIIINSNGIRSTGGMSLYIENNSDLNIGVMVHAFAINGCMIGGNSYGFGSTDVASGKKANTVEDIDRAILDLFDIESFDTLDILFWVYNNDASFKEFDTGQIHVDLSDNASDDFAVSGETIYDKSGIKVDYLYSSGNSYTYCLTNTTGTYLNFSVENLTINDYTSSDVDYDLYNELILNNCQYIFTVNPSKDFLSMNNISEISKIEYTLNIKPEESYFNDWNTGMITYPIN